MILFRERSKQLRRDAIIYIVDNLEAGMTISIVNLQDYLEIDNEVGLCKIEYVEMNYQEVVTVHYNNYQTGKSNNSILEDLSTDLLCNIADAIHLKSVS